MGGRGHSLLTWKESTHHLHSSFISSLESLQDATTLFHLEKLKDLTSAQEYAVTVSNRFGVLDTLEDPEELWDTFKCETLEAAKECIGERLSSQSGFTTVETLESIEESRAARLAGDHNQYRALSHRTRTPLRRDKERYSMAGVSLRMSSVI